jgi:hypothetical protein
MSISKAIITCAAGLILYDYCNRNKNSPAIKPIFTHIELLKSSSAKCPFIISTTNTITKTIKP